MDLDSTFSMESGQVKTGEDKQDTFFKMLQEVVRITPPVAEGIVQKYPSVMSLTKAFQDEGPLMLQELRVSIASTLVLSLECPLLIVILRKPQTRVERAQTAGSDRLLAGDSTKYSRILTRPQRMFDIECLNVLLQYLQDGKVYQ